MKPDIATIRARAEAATPGEWRATRNSRNVATVHLAPTLMFDTEIAVLRDFAEEEDDPPRDHLVADADFIAAARTDVPAICDRVEVLEAALREVLPLAEAWMELDDGSEPSIEECRAVAAARAALEGT